MKGCSIVNHKLQDSMKRGRREDENLADAWRDVSACPRSKSKVSNPVEVRRSTCNGKFERRSCYLKSTLFASDSHSLTWNFHVHSASPGRCLA
mmetsp:Transcript_44378/g.118405  ORF Transcript_44378/g.118405 Transcript_44378/m.118405 type:complete len:93 (+) Transcript_44378:265-543(+)